MASPGAVALIPHPAGTIRQKTDGYAPNVARMHNYLLDGKDHFAADRSAVEELLQHAPELYTLVRAERLFLMRGVHWLAGKMNIDQFIDLGCGLPIGRPLHERAAGAGARPRVVHVDNDPVVVAHGRALVDDGRNAVTVAGDVRDPEDLLREVCLTGLIDLGRPVAVLCSALLHHLHDGEGPWEIVEALRGAMAPGSALLVSHLCGDHAAPRVVDVLEQVYTGASAPLTLRSRDQITRLFDGFALAPPGVLDVAHWPGARPPSRRGAIVAYGGMGHLPAA